MAKRRKLQAPSAQDLDRIEDEYRQEVSGRGAGLGPAAAVPPIAQVAADAAALSQTAPTEQRAREAQNAAQAEELVAARAEGRLLVDIPLSQVEADAMVRDRIELDEEEQAELRRSIEASGLRLPIEVFPISTPEGEVPRYALVSGYRRYRAVQSLFQSTGDEAYRSIRALVREAGEANAAFVAMVEENEVRSELSHFERGRIAVIAAQQGAFVNVEDAVAQLFATASKAKRSKVRSFALIFEELGDMLSYPEQLTEKRGLRLAQGLRNVSDTDFRQALAHEAPQDGEEEWALLEAVLQSADPAPRDPSRGGRPKKAEQTSVGWQNADTLRTSAGITICKRRDQNGFLLRLEGPGLDSELMDSLMMEIQSLLSRR